MKYINKILTVILSSSLLITGCSSKKETKSVTLENDANVRNDEYSKKADSKPVETDKKNNHDSQSDEIKQKVNELVNSILTLYDYKLATPKVYDDAISSLKNKNAKVNFDFRNSFLESYSKELKEAEQIKVKAGVIESKSVMYESDGLVKLTIDYKNAISIQNTNKDVYEVGKNIQDILKDSELQKSYNTTKHQDIYEIKINTVEKSFEINLISSY